MRAAAERGVLRASVLRVEMSAEDGGARVRIDYVLETDGDVVPVELLRFGASEVDALELADGADGRTVRLLSASGRRLAAELPLPAPGPDGLRRLSVSYDVRSAVETDGRGGYRVRVPVASLAVPPPSDVAGRAFSAEVRVPAEWSVTEGFPSGLSATPDGRISVELAVVPAVVSFRGRTDGRSPPGLQLVLALIGGVALAGLGAAGWRHLHRVTS